MANQKGKDAFEFVRSYLEKKPGAPYAEVAAAAKAAKHKIWPIVYGRAQLLLGQTGAKAPKKKAARKTHVAKKVAARTPTAKPGRKPGRRGPGRPAKSPAVVGLDGLVAHIKGIERERDQLQATLDKIRNLLG